LNAISESKAAPAEVNNALFTIGTFDSERRSEDRYEGLFAKAMAEIQNESKELANAHQMFEQIKTRYEEGRRLADQKGSSKGRLGASSSHSGLSHGLKKYRDCGSPISGGSSPTARSPPSSIGVASTAGLDPVAEKTCPVCNTVFANRQSMLRHTKRLHKDDNLEYLYVKRSAAGRKPKSATVKVEPSPLMENGGEVAQMLSEMATNDTTNKSAAINSSEAEFTVAQVAADEFDDDDEEMLLNLL